MTDIYFKFCEDSFNKRKNADATWEKARSWIISKKNNMEMQVDSYLAGQPGFRLVFFNTDDQIYFTLAYGQYIIYD